MELTGTGFVAILSHGRGITLVVAHGHHVYTDTQSVRKEKMSVMNY